MSEIYTRPDSPYWQIRTRKGTRRTSEIAHSTGNQEQDKLNKEQAEHYAHIVEGQEWQIHKLGDHTAIPFEKAVEAYLALHAAEPDWGSREKDVITWLLETPAPHGPQLGPRSIKEVADWDALCELQALSDLQGRDPKTTNRFMGVVSAILHCNPKWFQTRVRIPLHQTKRRARPYIPAERIPVVCQHLPWHLALAAQFAVVTLLRMRAMLSLRWCDVYAGDRWATIRPEFQKTNEPFGFALTDQHLAILDQLKQHQWDQWQEHARATEASYGKNKARREKRSREWDHEHVFTWYGRKIDDCNTRSFQKAVRDANCPQGFNWHSWRHVGATLARLAGMSLPDLQALGGWESIASVEVYAHISPQALMPAAQKLANMLPGVDQIARMRRRNAPHGSGGAGGDRTRDPDVANVVLSHLSYSPTSNLPNDYHPGPRCSCPECLRRYPAAAQITHADLLSRAEKDPEMALLVSQLANKLGWESAALRTPQDSAGPATKANKNKGLPKTPSSPVVTQRPKKAVNSR